MSVGRYPDARRASGWGVLDFVLIFFAGLVFLTSLWINVRLGHGTLERISTDSMSVHADFDSFWRSARAMWEGRDVYEAGARLVNLNPPLWTVLLAPFGLMEPLTAYRWFVLITLFMTIAYLAWMADELRLRPLWATLAMGALLLSSPLLATLALGQMYPVLALGLVAAWVADRRERHLLSGISLGMVVALKPSLVPILLWPVVQRRWKAFGAAVASGVFGTLAGVAVLGPKTTIRYLEILRDEPMSAYWDNASLPSAAARLFTPNEFAEPLATLPWMIPVAYTVGIGLVILTALRVQKGPEGGLWALVAASLLISPVAWHNYLVLLAPGVLLLLARGRVALGVLLLALQFIPPQWPLLWSGQETIIATLALTLYLYILLAHWATFFIVSGEPTETKAETEAAAEVLE